MADWSQIKTQILDSINKAQDKTVQPGDEERFNDTSNLTNMAVNAFGLPQSWKMNLADEKQAMAELPMRMGMGSMGTIENVGSKASQIAAKIEQAIQQGYKPTAAEGLALAKYRGNNLTTTAVIPTAQEAAQTKALFNMAPKK